jgi:hypothetical protein
MNNEFTKNSIGIGKPPMYIINCIVLMVMSLIIIIK